MRIGTPTRGPVDGRERSATRVSSLALALAGVQVAALVLLWAHGPLLDLHIYRMGGGAVLSLSDTLYELMDPASGLVFTYPPFAAVLFAPLTAMGRLPAEILVTTGSVCALARTCVLLHRRFPERLPPAWVLLIAGAVLEPSISTVAFGQINLLLMWLVVEDLLGHRRCWAGLLIGLATGIKLVPGVFILALLVAGRTRAAAVAMLTTLATMVIGCCVLPGSSMAYWSQLAYADTRVGGVAYIANQSLNGALWRIGGPGGNTALWLSIAVCVAGYGLWSVRLLHVRGEHAAAMAVAALVGLLVSPVSWSHHWVWSIVVVAALIATDRRRWALAWLAITGTWLPWLVPHGGDREYLAGGWQLLLGNSYVLLGVATLLALSRPAWVRLPGQRRRALNPAPAAPRSRSS